MKTAVLEKFSVVLGLTMIFGVVIPANAATTANVSATVTVQNVSVSVTDGAVAYGTLQTSGTADTSASGVNDTQTATNNGNVSEDFDIQGADTTAWTLAGTQGSETYFHKYCTSDCDGTPTWTALTTSYQSLASAVAASGTQDFDLQIGVPSSTATFTEQTATVTVQASAS